MASPEEGWVAGSPWRDGVWYTTDGWRTSSQLTDEPLVAAHFSRDGRAWGIARQGPGTG